jgi:hemerythrin-like domain-containing protein
MDSTRRQLLVATTGLALTGVGALALVAGDDEKASPRGKRPAGKGREQPHPEEDVGATEDLMREHGVLNRILLIYEEGLRRLRARVEVAPEAFRRPAELVRRFVEDYHERLEENFIFPLFERANRLNDLVRVLRQQHQAGRAVTDIVLRCAAADQFRRPERRRELVRACEQFIRMYRPHEAREDTVLFPALHRIATARQLRELGERFEREEDRLFGEEGFERTVDQVAAIERQLGIDDLAQFTPRLPAR